MREIERNSALDHFVRLAAIYPVLNTCNGILSRSREISRRENSLFVLVRGGQKSWELWLTDFDPRATHSMEAAILKEAGATRAAKRTEYCRQQAAECALAATAAILGEVRQAYLNIEQA